MQKIRNWLFRLMYGRNGVDSLSRAMMIPVFVFFIVSIFIKNQIIRSILMGLGWLCIFVMYFRMFSKNIANRKKENAWFESKIYYLKTKISQSKDYRFFNCPKCGTHLRVPKGVGKITITCKTCGHKFDRKA